MFINKINQKTGIMKKIIVFFLVCLTFNSQAQKLLPTNFGAIPKILLDSSKTDLATKTSKILELLSEQIKPDSNYFKVKSYNALSGPQGITFYLLIEDQNTVYGFTFHSNHFAYSGDWQNTNWLEIKTHEKWQDDKELSWNNDFFDEIFYDLGTDGYCDGYQDLNDSESNFINIVALKPMKKIFIAKSWPKSFNQKTCFAYKNSQYANLLYLEILQKFFSAYEKYL